MHYFRISINLYRTPDRGYAMNLRAESPFDRPPKLPVVRIPWPGEALGSWLRAVFELYGFEVQEFMRYLGEDWCNGWYNFDLRILFRPSQNFFNAVNLVTGISVSRLRNMALEGLDPYLADACFRHYSPCQVCECEAAAGAGRPVMLLHACSPWRVVCPKHPPAALLAELAYIDNPGGVLAKIAKLIEELDVLFRKTCNTKSAIEPLYRVHGDFVRFVYMLNSFVSVRLEFFGEISNRAKFTIVRIFERDEYGIPIDIPRENRNNIGISLLFAWYLTRQFRKETLRHLRVSRTVDGKEQPREAALLGMLWIAKEFWSREIAVSTTVETVSETLRQWTIQFASLLAYNSILSEIKYTKYNHTTNRTFFTWNARYPFYDQRTSEFPSTGPFEFIVYCTARRNDIRNYSPAVLKLASAEWAKPPNHDRIKAAISRAINELAPVPAVSGRAEQKRTLCRLQRLAERYLAEAENSSSLSVPVAFLVPDEHSSGS
jgi:hypothetical protein